MRQPEEQHQRADPAVGEDGTGSGERVLEQGAATVTAAPGGPVAGAEAEQRRRAEEGPDGDRDRPARGDRGEQHTAHPEADQQCALGDDPQQGAAQYIEVALAEDVGERGHTRPGEDGRHGGDETAQCEEPADGGAGQHHDGDTARADQIAGDQDPAGGVAVGDPGEERAADEVREEAEREGEGAEQGRAGEVVDEDGERELADDDTEEGEQVRGEDGTELPYGEDGAIAAGCTGVRDGCRSPERGRRVRVNGVGALRGRGRGRRRSRGVDLRCAACG